MLAGGSVRRASAWEPGIRKVQSQSLTDGVISQRIRTTQRKPAPETPDPSVDPRRLSRLLRTAVEQCQLDLTGLVVLTEAATGPYVVTPLLAALAGGQVYAVAGASRYGTIDHAIAQTLGIANHLDVADRINIVTDKTAPIISQADIVTNCGHVRPITAEMIDWMKPTAVIPLMYESWEFRRADIDLLACRVRGIAVGATNERHPFINVFSYLGLMAAKLLLDAGVGIYSNHILLLCDNAFCPYLTEVLVKLGARVTTSDGLSKTQQDQSYDAILVALRPRSEAVISTREAELIGQKWPSTIVIQFWGDVDRDALAAEGVLFWPARAPESGHMSILPSALGPEPVVRLQAGGLKVGEILAKQRQQGKPAAKTLDCLRASGFGSEIPAALFEDRTVAG